MEVYSDIIKNELNVDCLSMKFTQRTTHNPSIIETVGFIRHDEKGRLVFRAISIANAKSSIEKIILNSYTLEPGHIKPESDYFDIEAIDIFGRIWTSERIECSADVNVELNSAVILGYLNNLLLTRKVANHKSCSLITVCKKPLYLSFDFHEGDVFSISVKDVEYNLSLSEGLLHISFGFNLHEDCTIYESAIINGLSVLMGARVEVLYTRKIIYDNEILSVNRKPYKSQGRLLKPLGCISESGIGNMKHFLTLFCEKYVSGELYELYGFWHKLFSVSNGMIEAKSLTCGVVLEGVIKKYYHDRFAIDDVAMQCVHETELLLKDIEFDKQIKSRLIGALSNYKNKSPRTVMLEVCKELSIPTKLVSIWNDMRNKAAHASDIDMSDAEFEKAITYYNSCVYLFYRLFFDVIGYSGSCINYSLSKFIKIELKAA
ncbi:hypothetical protein [Plesiomonas shigelloides]|uniref:hypothetical protein n=3 Tax=Plesiomonas shigelloides TaxID=703 RepID=UPI0012625757|nr:hypothetical protein [Plesiomonas shigelloides]KAB7660141.1 hypothetical protein GBN14_03595 [Plesiomonas shigelloides]